MLKIFVFALFTLNSLSFDSTKEASELLLPFKKELMKTLKSSLKSGGVKNAINTCHLSAKKIEAKHNDSVITLGRSSLKYRNPLNKPEKWLIPILENYEMTKSVKAQIVSVDKDKIYIEPIYVKGLCLNCHGNISQVQKKLIGKLYPSDKAVGYKMGDFRGVFWMKKESSKHRD